MKRIFCTKNEKIKTNLLELEKNQKKYYDYDDTEYKGIRDVRFCQLIKIVTNQ